MSKPVKRSLELKIVHPMPFFVDVRYETPSDDEKYNINKEQINEIETSMNRVLKRFEFDFSKTEIKQSLKCLIEGVDVKVLSIELTTIKEEIE